jgi:hypothetical protein
MKALLLIINLICKGIKNSNIRLKLSNLLSAVAILKLPSPLTTKLSIFREKLINLRTMRSNTEIKQLKNGLTTIQTKKDSMVLSPSSLSTSKMAKDSMRL